MLESSQLKRTWSSWSPVKVPSGREQRTRGWLSIYQHLPVLVLVLTYACNSSSEGPHALFCPPYMHGPGCTHTCTYRNGTWGDTYIHKHIYTQINISLIKSGLRFNQNLMAGNRETSVEFRGSNIGMIFRPSLNILNCPQSASIQKVLSCAFWANGHLQRSDFSNEVCLLNNTFH